MPWFVQSTLGPICPQSLLRADSIFRAECRDTMADSHGTAFSCSVIIIADHESRELCYSSCEIPPEVP